MNKKLIQRNLALYASSQASCQKSSSVTAYIRSDTLLSESASILLHDSTMEAIYSYTSYLETFPNINFSKMFPGRKFVMLA